MGEGEYSVWIHDSSPLSPAFHGYSPESITPELFSKGRLLANKCLKMYIELHNTPCVER